MKITRFLFAFVIILSILGMSVGVTQAQKLNPYASTINVQNLGTATANITLTYYNTDGTVNTSTNDTLAVNESKNYITLPVSAGFTGSAVISSDQPLAALSNLNHSSGGSVVARESFLGAPSGANTVYLPLLASKLGAVSNDTWFSVQNAGSSTATVNIVYSDCATGNPAALSIAPGASKTVNNAVETCHATKSFAGTLTSDQPVVVVVVQEKFYNVASTQTGVMYSYTGLTNGGSPLQSFPIVTFNNSGNRTGIQVQNTTATSTNITIHYTHDANTANSGTDCDETQTVAGNASVTFGWPAWIPSNPSYTGTSTCTRGQLFIGSGTISVNSASVNVQTVVSQIKDGTNRAGAYTGFQTSQATGKFVMPLIMDRVGSSSLITVIQVYNMDTVTDFYQCVLTGTGSTGPHTYSDKVFGSLGANQSARWSQFSTLDSGFVGSGVCQTYTDATFTTLQPSGKIVAVVNQVTSNGNLSNPIAVWDSLQIYSAINTAQ